MLNHRRKRSLAQQLAHNGVDETKPSVAYNGGTWQGQTEAVYPHEIGPGSKVGRSELADEMGRRELP
jgi:hypothetical protein